MPITCMDDLPHVPRPVTRFLAEYQDADTGDCWPWLGATGRKGYGVVFWRWPNRGPKVGTSAHRVVYIATRGAIPAGLVLDHLCRNPPCCNPWHLEPVTSDENMRRGLRGVLSPRRRAATGQTTLEGTE